MTHNDLDQIPDLEDRHTTERVWTTREGERIPMQEMTDYHLANAIALLERNGFTNNPDRPTHPIEFLGIAPPRGEMALDAWNDALEEMDEQSGPPYYNEHLMWLIEERERRERRRG